MKFFVYQQSNTTPHSDDDDKSEHDYQRSPPTKYLDESPPHDDPESFAQQQRELLERLKEQFTSFPFSNHVSGFPAMDLSDTAQRLQHSEAHNDFPFSSFPTPPPTSKDEMKISSSSAKKSASQNNNSSSWSYEDQFKQVRQVSWCFTINFT